MCENLFCIVCWLHHGFGTKSSLFVSFMPPSGLGVLHSLKFFFRSFPWFSTHSAVPPSIPASLHWNTGVRAWMCAWCVCVYMPTCGCVYGHIECGGQRLVPDVFLSQCPLYLLRWGGLLLIGILASSPQGSLSLLEVMQAPTFYEGLGILSQVFISARQMLYPMRHPQRRWKSFLRS